ncbi:MAG: CHC2 zinc finger domain-containing protein [Clostridiales bacterium]|nr:CHC2 zinc finger domain-containing protein [Clostridiales bacterium]
MTAEEIKSQYTMRDILARYGIQPNRAGFCHCPFHKGDREPSMKVYEKDWHCYGCNRNGDIFTFVQLMDGLSFKDAFLSLGGTYEKNPSFSSRAALYRAKKAKEQRQKEQERLLK